MAVIFLGQVNPLPSFAFDLFCAKSSKGEGRRHFKLYWKRKCLGVLLGFSVCISFSKNTLNRSSLNPGSAPSQEQLNIYFLCVLYLFDEKDKMPNLIMVLFFFFKNNYGFLSCILLGLGHLSWQ